MKAILKVVHPVLMVRNIPASIAFFEKLGFHVSFKDLPEHAKYAGIRRDGVELHLQWHDPTEWTYPNDRPTYRFLVDDVDGLSAEFEKTLPTADRTKVGDTAWGTREFHVRDPDSNGLQFYRDL